MRKALNIIIPILVCFLVGLSASYFQADAIMNWYPTLIKPAVTPPNIVFPIAWSIIYVCMGLSIGLLINSTIERRRFFIKAFIGFINILLLDIFVINYTLKSYQVNKASSILFIPYIIWLLFATYLNGYILMYN